MQAGNTGLPRLKAPPGTCDTHMHFYDQRYPRAAAAKILHGDALVPEYMAMRKRLGIDRTVVVQPTAYGTDNRCTLEGMAAIGPSARGVAVVDQTVTDEELDRLTKLGIRGIRFFMLPGGALPWEILETMASRVGAFGWHVQLQLDGRELPEREALLKRLTGTLVIDHVGKFLEPVPVDHPAFAVLQRLVENGRTWVKLSAPYEVSKAGPPNYEDVGALAKILVRVAPERMVWATNWPHPMRHGAEKPDDAVLLDMLLDWVPDEAARHKVLVDNPARLYGYCAAAMENPKNRFKDALRAGKPQIGIWGSIPSSYTAEVVAGAGFDWLLIDTEHTPADIENVLGQVHAVSAYPTVPVVRVPWNDMVVIKRYLDIGVQSLMIPQVTTVEEAKNAVAFACYPTRGMRGVAGTTRATRFGRTKNYFRDADREICILLQLESAEALKNLEAIAAIDGVDGIFIGPADLHASLGHLGELSHDKVLPMIDDAIVRTVKAGKAPGILTASEELARRWLKLGALFVAVGADVGILARGADALVAKYKG